MYYQTCLLSEYSYLLLHIVVCQEGGVSSDPPRMDHRNYMKILWKGASYIWTWHENTNGHSQCGTPQYIAGIRICESQTVSVFHRRVHVKVCSISILKKSYKYRFKCSFEHLKHHFSPPWCFVCTHILESQSPICKHPLSRIMVPIFKT